MAVDFGAVLSAAPGLGVGGTLFALVIYLLRTNHTERAEYRTALGEEEERNARQIAEERAAVAALRLELDEERKKRFSAEEDASRLRRGEPSA